MTSVTRTLEPGITMFTASEIRVAVVPVGAVPKELMEDYLEKINKFRHVPLAAARSFYRETQKSPFQHLPWTTGCLHFRFVTGEDARRRTRMSELHCQRQVVALLGIVHCPDAVSIQEAYKEFQSVIKQFPEAFTYRCFLFEPSEEQVQEDSSNLQNAVMFPPGTNMDQYLEVWMHDMAAAVLTEIEKWMLNASPSMMKLNTYCDSAEFTGQLAVVEEMQKIRMQLTDEEVKKQKWGRLQKAKGDMCLLGGSPRDAADNYKSAIDLAKTSSDHVWHAASLEGLAHALIMEALAVSSVFTISEEGTGTSTPPTSPEMSPAQRSDAMIKKISSAGFGNKVMWGVVKEAKVEEEVRKKLAEARTLLQTWYKKRGGAVAVQVEQQLKLARLLAGLKGLGARREANECATWIMEQLPALPLPEDRLIAVGEVAQVLGLVGLSRKRALLLWHAAELCKGVDTLEQHALRIAIKALEPPDDPFQQDPDDLPRQHWTQKRDALARSWEAVHMAALQSALSAAKLAAAHVEAWEAAATLLREHQNSLDPGEQRMLLEALAASTAGFETKSRLRHGQGPGPLVQVKRVLPLSAPLQPIPLSVMAVAPGAASQGPFIFNPFAAKRQTANPGSPHPDWVCGDEGKVEVCLSNPLAHPLALERLCLHATMPSRAPGGPKAWQALPVIVTLPPNGKTIRVTLSITPLLPGQLVLLGCQAVMGGVQWSQPFTPFMRRTATGIETRPAAARGAADQVIINVLPPLPLLQATLHGPDFHATYPAPEEIAGSASSPTTLSSLSSNSSSANVQDPPAVPSVLVHEGQQLTFQLSLTNIANESMLALAVVVSPPKGPPLKPMLGRLPPPDLQGAHVDVDTSPLAAALPVGPGGTVTLPVRVTVGRCFAGSFEDMQLEIRVTFVGELAPDDPASPRPPIAPKALVPAGSEEALQMGRRLVVPLQLAVRPSLQTLSLMCLEQHLPLPDGEKRLTTGPSGSTLPWGALERVRRVSRSGATRVDEANVVECSQWAQLASCCLVQLQVRNSSDRYFRAWVAPLHPTEQPEALCSNSEMIEPQSEASLHWLLLPNTPPPPLTPTDDSGPAPVTPSKARGGKGRNASKEGVEAAQCAEFIADSWGLLWELITGGDGQGGEAPAGMLRLNAASMARDVSSLTVLMTRPTSVSISCVAVCDGEGKAARTLHNLAAPYHSVHTHHSPSLMGGNIWAVRAVSGEVLAVEVRVSSSAPTTLHLTASITATTYPSGAAADTPENLCVALTGSTSNFTCTVQPGEQSTLRLAAMVLRPGLYQLHVRDVRLQAVDAEGQRQASVSGEPPLLPLVNPLIVMCN